MACDEIGTTLRNLPIQAGYYRLADTSDEVRRCPDASQGCRDDKAQCAESNSACLGTARSDDDGEGSDDAVAGGRRLQSSLGVSNSTAAIGCRRGLEGVYCRLCAPHDRRVFYRAASRASAAACPFCYDIAVYNIFMALLACLLVALSALVLWIAYGRLPRHRKAQLIRAWRSFTPHNKLKVLNTLEMHVALIPCGLA